MSSAVPEIEAPPPAPATAPATAPAPRSSRARAPLLLPLALLVGIAARVAGVDRPLDHRLPAAWREADYTQIARNFYREDMRLLYPRIDWRGDTPGYVEMELPILPWTAAALYRRLGYHEEILRLLSALAAVASLLLFARLARGALAPAGALVAVAAFALNPLLIQLATAMQPESLTLLLSLAAVALIWKWEAAPRGRTLVAAAAALALAGLAKAPALYLGLVLAWAVVRRRGLAALADPRVIGAALVAVLPPVAWYAWAHRFFTLHGNSLGVSNESHFIGLDLLAPPSFLLGNLKWETLAVFTPAGWLLALAGLRARSGRSGQALLWYGATWALYVVIARTSGDDWARYYHSASVPPACLLMGAGYSALRQARAPRRRAGLAAALTLVSLATATGILIRHRDSNQDLRAMRECALELARQVPPGGSIVVNGGPMRDERGHPIAHNASMAFAWMDRRGFNYATEELGPETLERIAARGGRWWLVNRRELERTGLGPLAARRYRLVAECAGGYSLYDLDPEGSR